VGPHSTRKELAELLLDEAGQAAAAAAVRDFAKEGIEVLAVAGPIPGMGRP